MLNKTQQAKIIQFTDDEQMASSVKEVLRDAFLKGQSNDVNFLAAQTLAVRLLEDGWRDLMRLKTNSENGQHETQQVGL